MFVSPPLSLSLRNRYFGRSGRWERTAIRAMNRQLVMLSRVVLHPTYRGAGLAPLFIRRSCELCPYRWVEALAQMGQVNPFFERAGFVRVGTTRARRQSRASHSMIYGGRRQHGGQGLVTEETHRKSRYARPVYYVFDNRGHGGASGRRDESGRHQSAQSLDAGAGHSGGGRDSAAGDPGRTGGGGAVDPRPAG